MYLHNDVLCSLVTICGKTLSNIRGARGLNITGYCMPNKEHTLNK